MSAIDIVSEHRAHGGVVAYCRHESASTGTPMRFGVFTPPSAKGTKQPVIYYLAGLTCTEETFLIKSGALRMAASLGLVLVTPDTSPRDAPLPGDRDSWDFGVAAGFYVDATQSPWSQHYQMESYVATELPAIVAAHFPVDGGRQGLCGHSMGGHGALTLALKYPERFRSVSALAPIVAPTQCPWGVKAFTGYLGADRSTWGAHDATELVRAFPQRAVDRHILIDQGLADPFLERELRPELFEAACRDSGVALTVRRHPGYDHGYYFVSTFIDDHLRHHAQALGA